MSIARHFRLFLYAILTAFLAWIVPRITSFVLHILTSLFNCTDNGSGFTCGISQMSGVMSLTTPLFVIVWGVSWLTAYAAAIAALLLLMSLLFRLGILLVMRLLIRAGQ